MFAPCSNSSEEHVGCLSLNMETCCFTVAVLWCILELIVDDRRDTLWCSESVLSVEMCCTVAARTLQRAARTLQRVADRWSPSRCGYTWQQISRAPSAPPQPGSDSVHSCGELHTAVIFDMCSTYSCTPFNHLCILLTGLGRSIVI